MQNGILFSAARQCGDVCCGKMNSYVIAWARNPDKGSAFEKAASKLLELPDHLIPRELTDQRYDGFLYFEGSEVVAHVFFQEHRDELDVFSVHVASSKRGQGIGSAIVREFLEYAHKRAGIVRVRIGAGNSTSMNAILETILEDAASLSFPIRRGAEPGLILFG